MNTEIVSQKERFLQEVEQKLLRRDLDAKLLENGLLHVSWNEKPLCSVDRDGIVRFRPADITGPEVDRQLRTVIQAAGQVKEYMRVPEVPALRRKRRLCGHDLAPGTAESPRHAGHGQRPAVGLPVFAVCLLQ